MDQSGRRLRSWRPALARGPSRPSPPAPAPSTSWASCPTSACCFRWRPSDDLRGYRFVSALARRDNERIAAFRADLQALASVTRAELEARAQQASLLRTDLERTRAALDADRRRKTELLTSLVEKKEVHAAYLQELEDAEGQARRAPRRPGRGRGVGPHRGLQRHAALAGGGTRPDDLRPPQAPEVRHLHRAERHRDRGRGRDARWAVHEGTVVFADRFRGYGLMVVLDHGGKHHSLYAHLGGDARGIRAAGGRGRRWWARWARRAWAARACTSRCDSSEAAARTPSEWLR